MFESRQREILCNFSVSTNVRERTRAMQFFQNRRDGVHFASGLTPNKNRQIMRDTKFVISPPGNGPDCHRTWEAIYLGAVPVVLRKYWGFSREDLPVIVLDDWSEIDSAIKNFNPWNLSAVSALQKLYLDFFSNCS
jgi:hypothetical protein